MKRILLLTALAFGLNSCKTLPNYYCVNKENIDFKEVNYSGFNTKTGLRWLLFKDATHFNLWLDTDNTVTQNKILYSGFTLYFDKENKKNKNVSVKFPYKTERKFTMKDLGGSYSNDHFTITKSNRLETIINKLPKNVLFKKDDEKSEFNYLYNESDIRLEIGADNQSLLYKIRIPLDQIITSESKSFTMGLESGVLNFELPEGMQAPNQNTAIPNTSGTPGNRNSAGTPGAFGASGISGKQRNLSTFNEIEEPIKLWFKVNLTDI